MSQQPPRREDFDIAIICALPLEYNAFALLFDEFWDEDEDIFGRAIGDLNLYTTGRIGKHDVVLALLSHVGKANAASAAANMRSSYGALRLVILAGICSGVPCHGGDAIFLGDVVISSSVIQYDFSRNYPNGFVRKNTDGDNVRKYDKNVRNLLTILNTDGGQERLQERTAQFLKQLQGNAIKHQDKYRYPGKDKDKLFESGYRHKHRNPAEYNCSICHGGKDPVCDEALASSCDDLGCNEEYIVERVRVISQDEDPEPSIYIGAVASSDAVIESGEDRDRIAREEGVIVFETEAAGVWADWPCIVVKGICDYADRHKNKLWQDFAAATAACASKAIIEWYNPMDRDRDRNVEKQPRSRFLASFRQNQDFIGKEAILSTLLRRTLSCADEERSQRTVLQGLGSIGKTQVALEAAYLSHNEHPDCSTIRVMVVDTGFEDMMSLLNRNFEDPHRHGEIQNTMITTLHISISFNQILYNGPLAANYLEFMSNLAGKVIPKSLLPTSTRTEAKDAIDTLMEYVSITQREGETLFVMHRLVRLATRNWLEKWEESEESEESAIQRLNGVMLFLKRGNSSVLKRLLLHVQTVLEFPKHTRFIERETDLFSKETEDSLLQGRYQIAERMYRQVLEHYKREFGNYHSKTLRNMNYFAALLTELGKYNEAEKIHRQMFELQCEVLGKSYPNTLKSSNNLALMFKSLGKSKQTEEIHQQTFELQAKMLDNDYLDTLGSMDNFAIIPATHGTYEDTAMMHWQRRQIAEPRGNGLGKGHSNTRISSYLTLALRHLKNGVDNDDVRYIASKADDMESRTSFAVTIEGTARTGRALIGEALSEQPQFQALCEKALAKTNKERFVKDMARLLQWFHICLAEEAKSKAEKVVAQLLRSEMGRQQMSDQIADKMGHVLAIKQGQEGDAEEVGLEDVREPDNPLKIFLSSSRAFKKLQLRFTLMFLPADLGYIVQSIPSDHIWLSKEQDVSISNRFKAFVEDSTKAKWNWWPLSPRKRMLGLGESRVFWKCTCGTTHWEEISTEQREFVQIALESSDNNPPLPSRCGVKKAPATMRSSLQGIIRYISGEQAASSSQAAQRYTPQNISPILPESRSSAPIPLRALLPLEQGCSTAGLDAQASSLESTDDLEWWILFGVRGAWRTLMPTQIHVNSQTTDGHIFQELKKHYRLHRRKMSLWLSVWQLDHCEVVKFHRLAADKMVREHKDLPPGTDYHYDPHKSGARNPPIPRDLFQTLFYACDSPCTRRFPHDCIFLTENTANIARIPKRIKKFEDSERSPIWGFEPVFSVSFAYVFVYHCVMLTGPFIFWVVWLKYRPGDLQDASVPLSIVLAALSCFWSGAGILTSRNIE